VAVVRAMSDTPQSKGGVARAAALTPEQRSAVAKRAATARWKNPEVIARWKAKRRRELVSIIESLEAQLVRHRAELRELTR